MANDLSTFGNTLLAQGLVALRNFNVMNRQVNSDYSNEAKQKNESITIPIPAARSASDVTPGVVPPASVAATTTSVVLTLDKWKESYFDLTDKEIKQIESGYTPVQVTEAVAALADQVNSDIFTDNYKGIYGYTGTAATTPFASNISDATAAYKILTQQKCPTGQRRMVIDPAAAANARNLQQFSAVNYRGDGPMHLKEGDLGRLLGFDWMEDQQVVTHTAGTITTGLIAKAATAQALGDKTIVCTTAASTGACALKAGDIITFNGHDQTYTVTADATEASASTDVTVNIEPGLQTALAGSEAVTVKASHVVNLAFHRNAIAFASRPLAASDIREQGSTIFSQVDPVSGIALRLEIMRMWRQTRYAFDILYGSKLVRPELACRVAG